MKSLKMLGVCASFCGGLALGLWGGYKFLLKSNSR